MSSAQRNEVSVTGRPARLVSGALAFVLLACSGEVIVQQRPVVAPIESITVSPALDSLHSIGESMQLTATAQRSDGTQATGVTFQWTSDNTAVATVDQNGRVVAVANGSARITATVDNASGSATAVVAQQPFRLDIVSGQLQVGLVGSTLSAPLVVRVGDRRDNPIAGIAVMFAVTPGGGAIDSPDLTSDGLGEVSVQWTLGTMPGQHFVRSAVVTDANLTAEFQATAIAETPDGTVVVTPPVDSLLSLGDTVQFTATAYRGDGTEIVGATFQWNSDNTAVAAIDQEGRAVAVANGSAGIMATADNGTGSATAIVSQRPIGLAVLSGQGQSGPVGTTLTDPLTVRVVDGRDNPVAGVPVSFDLVPEGGTIDNPNQATSGGGEVSVMWTLGTVAGGYLAEATVETDTSLNAVLQGLATPGPPAAFDAIVGDAQTGISSAALSDSVGVKVVDQYGNGVQDVVMTFAATSGGGSVSPAAPTTDISGNVRTLWTLGAVAGVQTLQATADGNLTATWVASALPLVITSIAPDPMIQGQEATLTGMFDPVPQNNTVTVDGEPAMVVAASGTSITVMLPALQESDCAPGRDVDVRVSVAGISTGERLVPLHPESNIVDLAVGEQMIVRDPDEFCLQFLPGDANAGLYVVGLTAAAELDAELPFAFTAEGPGGVAPSLASSQLSPESTSGAAGSSAPALEMMRTWRRHSEGESRLRAWERQYLPATGDAPAARLEGATVAASAAAPPMVGDVLTFHVPSNFDDVCSNATEISATVRAVGAHGVIATDVNQVDPFPLTDSDINDISTRLDDVYPVITDYIGSPSDLDANERVVIVLTPEVNKLGTIAGFATAADFVDPSVCGSSDLGEIFYGIAPDAGNTLGGIAHGRFDFFRFLTPFIAHEIAHTIQQSQRGGAGGTFMASWVSEGQAELVKEMAGHSLVNRQPYMDYDASAVNDAGDGFRWYGSSFESLGRYFGWDGDIKKLDDAPERCSLFGYESGRVPCTSGYGQGAAWSLLRYISDRFGPGYPGGEAGLQRDWIGTTTGLNGAALAEALLGVEFETLLAEWAAALWADGRVASPGSPLQFTSWDLDDIFNAFPATHRLNPEPEPAQGFHQARSVRGGSTAYLRFERVGDKPGLALRARGQNDRILGGTLKPVLWIVRGSCGGGGCP